MLLIYFIISIYNSLGIFCCNFYRFLKGLKSGVVDGVEKLMRDCAASEPLRRKSSFSHSHIFFLFAYLAIVAALFAQKIQKPQKMIKEMLGFRRAVTIRDSPSGTRT